MDIFYNIGKISEAVDAIDEKNDFLSVDRLIDINRKIISNADAGSDSLNKLSVSCKSWTDGSTKYSTGCYEILDRINIYLSCVQQNLNQLQDIYLESFKTRYKLNEDATLKDLDDEKNTTATLIELNSSIKDVYSNNMTFALTEYNNPNNIQQTFNLLSSFYTQLGKETGIGNDILNRRSYESSRFRLSKYQDLFNQQNDKISFTSDFDLDFQYTPAVGTKNTIINSFDVLQLLQMFINRLKNIKQVFLQFFHKQTSKNTVIKAYGVLPKNETETTVTGDERQSYYSSGRYVTLTISPYIEQTIPMQQQCIYITPTDYIKYRQKYKIDDVTFKQIISLNNLLYDVSSGAELQKTISLDADGSNGIFSNELEIIKNDTFKLSLSDVVKMFNIQVNTIIYRKNILKAIDYIFNTWLETMSTITYKITTCHNNCHNNSGEYGVKFTPEIVTSKLYEVGTTESFFFTGGCWCGNRTAGIINLLQLVPFERREADGFVFGSSQEAEIGGDLYVSYNKTCGDASPSSLTISRSDTTKKALEELYKVDNPTKASLSVVKKNCIWSGKSGHTASYMLRIDTPINETVKCEKRPFRMSVTVYTQYTILKTAEE